ncbi:MAG TPA: fibronectin type III domain-containing protein [Candidatus Angelobacter sp.]|jgi:phosphodiesterase/alkaline phosphatase D-like protein|nr:fibronectin type III domain-containing protein [Candidatus Angelobacter sp.]
MMKMQWFVIVLALVLCLPGFAQSRPAAEQIIDGPRVERVGDSWAVIAWSTNTGGSSVVHYGDNRDSLNQTAQSPYADDDNSRTQIHRVHLQNLKPGTTYYFVAISGQGEDTGTQATSSIGQFTTKGGTPSHGRPEHGRQEMVRITDGPRVEAAGSTWAVIAWTTNAGGSSVIHYGMDPNHLGSTAQSAYADNEESRGGQNHRVRIENLRPGTTYYFVAESGQGEGTGTDAQSSTGQFTTKAN